MRPNHGAIFGRHFGLPSLKMATWLVEMKNVSFTPGIAFGDGMNGFLRMCFATSEENIAQALEVLINLEKDFCPKLRIL